MPELTVPAEKALTWIERHRDEFSLRRGRDPWEQTMLLKPFSELMLTLTLLGRDPALHQRVAPMVQWSWAEVDSGATLIDLSSAKAELVEIVGLYADFAANGFSNDRLESWLSYLVATQVAQGLELPPWRAIAFRYNLRRIGMAQAPTLGHGSWLRALPEPWTISITTAYPLTHEVFYLTDFGRSPLQLSSEIREYLTTWLPAWQECFKDPENLDLLAELVMTAACIHADPDHETLTLLADRQFDDGSMRGPRGAGHDLPAPKADLERRRFLTNYHTTLVSALALTWRHWSTPSVRSLNDTDTCERSA